MALAAGLDDPDGVNILAALGKGNGDDDPATARASKQQQTLFAD